MPQVGRCPGFAQKALDALLGIEHVRLGHLERHFAVELRIIGPIDDAERSFAEKLADIEATDAEGRLVYPRGGCAALVQGGGHGGCGRGWWNEAERVRRA